MALLKVLFPFSFGKRDVTKTLITIILYIVIGAAVGWVIGLVSGIPILGIIFKVIGWLIDLYVLVGVVLVLLNFFKIIK